jgi:azurin
MKNRLLLASAVSILLLSGCGQKESSAVAAAAPTPAAVPAGPRVVEITAGDNMKFSLASIDAKVGEELKIVLTNIGTLPKEVMGHNFVILKKGSDAAAFSTAATTSKATGFIPEALKDEVIANTEVLGPRKSAEVTFKATEAGDYPFLCSFPAHYVVGMKGVISVK